MKKAMTNIIVFIMVALPLFVIGWVVYPIAYSDSEVSERTQQIAYISELEAVNEYQNVCNDLEYSCNEDLIQNVHENASKRSQDARASSTSLFDMIEVIWN